MALDQISPNLILTVFVALLCGFIGVRMGLRFFLFLLLSSGMIFLMVMLPQKFLDPLVVMLEPWIAASASRPTLTIGITAVVLATCLYTTRIVEGYLDMSEEANRASGGAVGIALGILIAWYWST